MALEEFKKIDKADYNVWADCGTQFRCVEFNYFPFDELASKRKSVDFNLFCEKHGKNMRDQHFSFLSKSVNIAKFKRKTSFKNAKEVVEYLNMTFSQQGSRYNSKSIAIFYNPPEKETLDIGRREIADLHCYYNLQNKWSGDGTFEFCSTIYSDLSEYLPVNCTVGTNAGLEFNRFINAKLNKVEETTNEERRFVIDNNITKKKRRTEFVINDGLLNFNNFFKYFSNISLKIRPKTTC